MHAIIMFHQFLLPSGLIPAITFSPSGVCTILVLLKIFHLHIHWVKIKFNSFHEKAHMRKRDLKIAQG